MKPKEFFKPDQRTIPLMNVRVATKLIDMILYA